MQVRVLGSLEAVRDDQVVELAGRRQRTVLALLVVHAPWSVSAEPLVDELWDEDAPATAANTLQVYVSQLRRALGRDCIVTASGAYRLQLDRHEVDAWQFADLVESGSGLLEQEKPAEAAQLFEAALDLWTGRAFEGIEERSAVRGEAERLEQLRLVALERRIEADIACGRFAEVVPELERLTDEHAVRERFWALLMRALYSAGRQADALNAYQRAREVLADELAVDPGPELRELEAAILRQDLRLGTPGLQLPPLPVEPASP